MTITRSLGILVAFGVPAIIGSGIVWELANNWEAVGVFLIVLALTALGFIDIRHR